MDENFTPVPREQPAATFKTLEFCKAGLMLLNAYNWSGQGGAGGYNVIIIIIY